MTVSFRPFAPDHVVGLVLQESQFGQFGIFEPVMNLAHGEDLQVAGPAWTAVGDDGVILMCAGFAETFAGLQAMSWALISPQFKQRRRVQRKIADYARHQIQQMSYRRIEAICRWDNPTENRWLRHLGFEFNAVMKNWGPLSEPYSLYESLK